MSTRKITGALDTKLEITTASNRDTWILTRSSAVVTDDEAIACAATKFTLNVEGEVVGFNSGIEMAGGKWTLNLASTSTVTAGYALMVGGKKIAVNINGDVAGNGYGIFGGADRAEFNIGVGAHVSAGSRYGIYHGILVEAEFQIDGSVTGLQAGLYSNGFGDGTINIGKTGLISGLIGLKLESINPGSTYTIHNDGEISGADVISANVGILDLVNGKGGVITGSSSGISANGMSVSIVNHGTIAVSNGATAIGGNSAVTSIVNDGLIIGAVRLGDGAGTFDTRGGVVRGVIEGNLGDDTLIVSDAKVKMVENLDEGMDTVQSTVSYTLGDNIEQLILLNKAAINGSGNALDNTLRGNGGSNTLEGLGGDDKLFGGKGNDLLHGGDGADIFVFSTGDGKDRVMDFVQGTDTVNLKSWSVFKSFDDLMKNHAVDSGDDLLISYKGDSLLILGVHKADVTDTDILV